MDEPPITLTPLIPNLNEAPARMAIRAGALIQAPRGRCLNHNVERNSSRITARGEHDWEARILAAAGRLSGLGGGDSASPLRQALINSPSFCSAGKL